MPRSIRYLAGFLAVEAGLLALSAFVAVAPGRPGSDGAIAEWLFGRSDFWAETLAGFLMFNAICLLFGGAYLIAGRFSKAE